MDETPSSGSTPLGERSTNVPAPPSTQQPITPPSVAREIFDALLGFAVMSFGDMSDLGRGPVFSSRELNARQLSNKRREDFIRAVGGDPADATQPYHNLHRFEVENAIVILVPKDVVDPLSLVKTPKDGEQNIPVKHITWLTKADTRCTVANGAGRIDFVQSVLCREDVATRRAQFNILKKNNGRDMTQPKVQEAQRIIRKMNNILQKTSTWMVAVYDLDAIERSENSTQIKLALAANVPAYQAPDSEDEALHLILTNISPLPEENWLKELDNYRSRIVSGPKRLAPVIRNQRLIVAIINVHRYARHWEDNMKVTQYYDWRTAISPFIEAFLHQGTIILDYLASNIPAPKEGDAVSINSILEKLNPVPDLLNAPFFSLISSCYARHLYSHRASYGVEDGMQEKGALTYEQAFKLYVEDLASDIPNFIEGRLSMINDTSALEEARDVLEGLLGRIRFALTSPVFNSANIGLELPTPTPLLCRAFLLDMGSYLHGLSSPLMEVFRMVDPMFPAVLLESRSSNSFKDQPTAMLEQLVIDLKPNAEPKFVVNKLLSIIFRHRIFALVKMNTLNNANPPKNPPRSELTGRYSAKASATPSRVGLFYHQDIALQSLLKAWRFAAVSGDPDMILTTKLRKSVAPSLEKASLEGLDHGDMLLRIVTNTGFRWAACTGSQMATVAKTVSGYALNTLWFHLNHHQRYIKSMEVWNMREDIDNAFYEHLRRWGGFWDEVVAQPDDVMPPLSQTSISLPRKLQLQMIGKQMHKKVNEGISSIVRILRRTEMGAIPIEDEKGNRIAENVYDAAENLFKELAIASMCAQSMYTDPSSDRMAIVQNRTRDDMLETLEIPAEFQKATETDTRAYYESMDVDTINKTDIFGEGSLKLRNKVIAQDKKKKTRRRGGLLSAEFVSARNLLEDDTLIAMGEKDPDDSDWDRL